MADGQLPLAFPHLPSLAEADFLPHEGTALALEFLARTPTWPDLRLALWGAPAAGKTHLLHIWAREQGATVVAGARLAEPFWPEGAVAIDDADQVGAEPALLHLLNAAAEAKRPVLLAARTPLARTGVRLPDLASRLRAITAVEIGPPDDAFLAALFGRLLAERQLRVAPWLQARILTRLPRTPSSIQRAVARLDYATLAAKSAVTPSLARAALSEWLGADAPLQRNSA